MFDLLKRLSDAHGVSGSEEKIAEIIKDELKDFNIYEDSSGNVIVTKFGVGRTVMVASHMDEIGLMVKGIKEDGTLEFATIGGFYDPTILAQRVILHTNNGELVGVIGGKPPHLMDDAEKKAPVDADKLFIYMGADTKEKAIEAGIEVGTTATFDTELKRMSGNAVTGKALDNRAGCAILVEVLKRIKTDNKVVGVFTVQEEVGLKGARVAANRIKPDAAIATDVTIGGEANIKLGDGPVVGIIDGSGRGLIANKNLTGIAKLVSSREDIPLQLEVGTGGTTDATAIATAGEGVPSITVSVATRFIHSPVEALDIRDLENAVRLCIGIIKEI